MKPGVRRDFMNLNGTCSELKLVVVRSVRFSTNRRLLTHFAGVS